MNKEAVEHMHETTQSAGRLADWVNTTCTNNWIRRIAGVRRVERRRMKDLREEVGTKACIVGKMVKSPMKWAGHMVRIKDGKLPKRS